MFKVFVQHESCSHHQNPQMQNHREVLLKFIRLLKLDSKSAAKKKIALFTVR
jgi:hypothetical protein